MSKEDDIFIKEFLVLLGSLVLFTIVIFFVGRAIGATSLEKKRMSPPLVAERIKPIGAVRTGKPGSLPPPAPKVAAAAPASAAAAARSGEQIYQTTCVACHATGVANAPKLGDKAAWAPRAGKGLAGLLASVLHGKGAMPPKGGNPALSEDDLKRAIRYLLKRAALDAG